MTTSFQDFADADGITTNFRMNLRGLCRLQHVYEVWCSTVAPPEWRRTWVMAQRAKGVINIKLDDGSVMTVKLR
jgi:hypothetical protein